MHRIESNKSLEIVSLTFKAYLAGLASFASPRLLPCSRYFFGHGGDHPGAA